LETQQTGSESGSLKYSTFCSSKIKHQSEEHTEYVK